MSGAKYSFVVSHSFVAFCNPSVDHEYLFFSLSAASSPHRAQGRGPHRAQDRSTAGLGSLHIGLGIGPRPAWDLSASSSGIGSHPARDRFTSSSGIGPTSGSGSVHIGLGIDPHRTRDRSTSGSGSVHIGLGIGSQRARDQARFEKYGKALAKQASWPTAIGHNYIGLNYIGP